MTFAPAQAQTDLGALTPLTVNLIDIVPPGPWDLEHVRGLMRNFMKPWHKVNLDYYNGDHWQEGRGWTGPTPPNTSDRASEFSAIMLEIQKGFVSKNVVAEIADRAIAGVLGHEPTWNFTPRRKLKKDEAPTTAEQALIDEAEALTTDWWDQHNVYEVLVEATTRALLTERGYVRFYVPSGFVNADDRGLPGTEEDWVRRLAVHSPEVGQAAIIIDPDTLQPVGVYNYSNPSGGQQTEMVSLLGEGATAQTVITIYDSTTVSPQGNPLPPKVSQTFLQLQGQLTIGEMKTKLLISEQVRKLQCMVNQALTMAQHNVNLAGFLERVVLNGQYPGHYEDIPGSTGPNGQPKQRWVRDSYETGAGAVNFIIGVPRYDKDTGNLIGYENPSMVYRDPVNPDSFDKTYRLAYRAILEEVQQIHALVSGDQYPSGESRRQARSDFETWLRKLKRPLNNIGRWMMMNALNEIAYLAGTPDKYASLRCQFAVRVDPGPATAESVRAAIEMNAADALSNETTMVWGGVEDPDAERQRIESERRNGILTPPFRDAKIAADKAQAAADAAKAAADAAAQQALNNPPIGGGGGGNNPTSNNRIPTGQNGQRREGAGAQA